ncbi:MAG: DNA-binding response regulator, partial [Chloroflexia bacterium]|nr:DNA-binding response regulator [Chloroflexia bacterium]
MTDRVPLRVLVFAAYPSARAGLAALLAREVGLEVEETDGGVGETAAAVHDVTVIDLTGFDDDWVETRVEHAAGRGLVLL